MPGWGRALSWPPPPPCARGRAVNTAGGQDLAGSSWHQQHLDTKPRTSPGTMWLRPWHHAGGEGGRWQCWGQRVRVPSSARLGGGSSVPLCRVMAAPATAQGSVWGGRGRAGACSGQHTLLGNGAGPPARCCGRVSPFGTARPRPRLAAGLGALCGAEAARADGGWLAAELCSWGVLLGNGTAGFLWP